MGYKRRERGNVQYMALITATKAWALDRLGARIVGAVRFEARFPALPVAVAEVRGKAAVLARRCGVSEQGAHDVALAVSEAAANVVVHSGSSEIVLIVEAHDGDLHVIVADDGPGLAPRRDSTGLRLGLPIIATVSSSFENRRRNGRNEVVMVFPCPAGGIS